MYRYNSGQGIVYPGFSGNNDGSGIGEYGGNTVINNSPIGGNGGGGEDDFYGMIFKAGGYRVSSLPPLSINLWIQIVIILYIVMNYCGLFTL